MIELSDATRARIKKMYPADDVPKVDELLRLECGDGLPLMDPSYAELAERVRFAVLKLSRGDFSSLRDWIEESKTDWRDVLMAAYFGEDVKAHLSWNP